MTPDHDSTPLLTCSAASALDEPLPGTAARVTAWLCIEQPGPWGRDIIADAVLGQPLSGELGRRTDAAGVRPMLIRRPGRSAPPTLRTVLIANSVPGSTWCERLTIRDLDELLDLDLALLHGAAPGIGELVTDPIVLVCAHSKRDQCCARFGRPIAAHLAERFGDSVWECSHTGGHRFAPSMILLPTGYTYGRLDAETSEAVVAAACGGEVGITGLRGRSAYSPSEQVAEIAVRQHVFATPEELTVAAHSSGAPLVQHRDGRRWEVDIRTRTLPPRPASCGASAKPVDAVDVVGLREVSAVTDRI